ncbi:hypothetical protein ABVT39_005288 [Epinephelus coioides]
MIDDKWLVCTEQKLELRGEAEHTCVGCCHYERTSVYCTVLWSRREQTGGEEKAEGRDGGDRNGEPLQQLGSIPPQCGAARHSAMSVVKNIERHPFCSGSSRLPSTVTAIDTSSKVFQAK